MHLHVCLILCIFYHLVEVMFLFQENFYSISLIWIKIFEKLVWRNIILEHGLKLEHTKPVRFWAYLIGCILSTKILFWCVLFSLKLWSLSCLILYFHYLMYAYTYMIEAFVSLSLHTHMALPFIILCKPIWAYFTPLFFTLAHH